MGKLFRSPFMAGSRQTAGYKVKGNWKCGYHTGIDRVCDKDYTIVSVGDGTVISVNACGESYGNHILIRCGEYVILYAHLRDKPAYYPLQSVKRGEKIGLMGNTGRSFGAHLHVEIQKAAGWAYAQELIDPGSLIDWEDFETEEEAFTAKKWKNGSTSEPVYMTTTDCRNGKNQIGIIGRNEEARCLAVTEGFYLVEYGIAGGKKCGYVRYSGGIR